MRKTTLALVSTLATTLVFAAAPSALAQPTVTDSDGQAVVLQAGHASLQKWKLPATPPHPENNAPTPQRVELGKQLFFDARLSGDGNMSCASCHSPLYGWSDALPTAKGFKSLVLGRASPTVINTAYNSLQMWDGRRKTLEEQAMGPMEANVEMNTDVRKMFAWLNGSAGYRMAFAQAYPGEAISADTVSKAIASFERTVISRDSAFDRWVAGDSKAMTADQVRGFSLFIDPKKTNCGACHSGPNFTDNGFHNLGLASDGRPDADVGRFSQKPLAAMKGAFKTPTVREAAATAPYFHDGSANTLLEVVEHYARGGVVKTNLSKDMRVLDLSTAEKLQLVAFMEALSSPAKAFVLPVLPR